MSECNVYMYVVRWRHDNVQLFMRFKMEFEENGPTENQFSAILNGQKLLV